MTRLTVTMTALAVGLGLTVAASTASAAVTFEGESSAVFTDIQPQGPGAIEEVVGLGTNSITFGSTGLDNPNELTFVGGPFGPVSAGAPFSVGTLTYYNGVTHVGNRNIDTTVTLNFTAPPGLGSSDFDFTFDLVITLNDGGGDDQDYLTPQAVFSENNFIVNGQPYTLELLGFSQDGGDTIVDEFVLDEPETVNADLYAQISAVPLPGALPAGLAMLSGMGVVRLRRRRRRFDA